MRTTREIWLLGRDSVRLWWRFLPQLGFWFCLGLLSRELGMVASTVLSDRRWQLEVVDDSALFWGFRMAETLVFVVGLIGWVICLVLMIASTRPGLRAVSSGQLAEVVPGGLAPARNRRELLLDAVPAFLAVFAVGGFAEEQIEALFQANLITFGGRFSSFSVSMADWQGYLVLAAAAALLALIVRPLLHRRSIASALLRLGLKSITVLAGFLGLKGGLAVVTVWLMGRRVWQWGEIVWRGLVDVLPDWRVWRDMVLPEVVIEVSRYFWNSVLPGLIDSVALPLLWLALAATVFGWHDFRHGVRASGREQVLLDASRRLVRGSGLGPGQLAQRWLINQTEDYLPTLQAFRLILRAGIRFAGAFVVVMAAVAAMQAWQVYLLDWWLGPLELPMSSFMAVFYKILELPLQALWVAVLACAFDRALRVLAAPAGVNPIGIDHTETADAQGVMASAQ